MRLLSWLKKYIFNILIGIDQWVNTLFAGDPDETISSRCGKRVKSCAFCSFLCFWLDKIDPRHCHKSIEHDEGKDAL